MDYALIWALILAIGVFVYVALDGFDLGVGILFPLLEDEQERDTAIGAIAPVWDGNETWLVLGGGGLLAVFPLAYSVIFPALYVPLIAMLLALVFRGVAFEFRVHAGRHKRFWDHAFFGGSLVAAFAQGISLGAWLQGIEVVGRSYSGAWWDWLTPFSVATGLALVFGYALLGAAWLNLKTEGALNARVNRLIIPLAAATIGFIVAVSLWTPFMNERYAARWFTFPTMIYALPVPLFVAATVFTLWQSLKNDNALRAFLSAELLFLLCYIGIGISVWPHIVPTAITIHDAAGPDKSLGFLLVGAVVLIPLILAYTAAAYWIFRGKVKHGGYHH
ncbi:cytochrome d ubiquinol oxidase subunit II [Hoeflea prorocentri]|uniref:Cytochrome d ubiquinol oxidase subunit II n=1 Tax=Hoeflea prorocentri TaxID=1922333 RepID=A0A9X3UEP9_9HYPH|nr:cytochrome d ubiquinol oxidase subunit II [Hoeflea prorocentri]MCY6379480.1 cytochrome d ubiquinol oxidase subunit II [Hoeflea prorocentri]MDA5397280.1 cytochrome d ubiquinol oxidase subunit II [Hoeflea prorocentri]